MNLNTSSEVIIEKIKGDTSKRESVLSWVRFLALLLGIFIVLRFGIGISIINGNSMNPTLEDGNIVLVNKLSVLPDRNDIVVVKDPNGYNIIKRVIALPGESIEIRNGNILIDNKVILEDYVLGTSFDIPKTLVPEGHFFIVGDNRTPGESLDSRDVSVGPINEHYVEGNAILSLLPLNFIHK